MTWNYAIVQFVKNGNKLWAYLQAKMVVVQITTEAYPLPLYHFINHVTMPKTGFIVHQNSQALELEFKAVYRKLNEVVTKSA